MNTVVWILAGVYVANVALVAAFILFLEIRRRRAQRELRELESLWQIPSASVAVRAERGGRVRLRARPAVPLGSDSERRGVLRAASYALALASVAAVILSGLLPPSSPDRGSVTTVDALDAAGSIPRLPGDLARLSSDLRKGEAGDAETDEIAGGGTSVGTSIVISGVDDTVSAVVAAQPASSTAIRLRWAEVPAATGYRIERQSESEAAEGGPWLMIAVKRAGVSTHTDRGLEAATTYFYRVTAMLEDGPAPTSDVVSATTPIAPPAAPTLTATVPGGGPVVLSWSDVEGETGYRVERLAEGEAEWTPIATTGEGIVVYENGSLTPGLSYQYRVIATGVGGDSEPSNVVEVVAPSPVGGGTPTDEPPQPGPAPDAVEPDLNTPDAIEPDPTGG
jgi:hypothetical protein